MSQYRRAYVPGGTFFLTLVTYARKPLFSERQNISRLRSVVARTRVERPFEIVGAVILPNHIHFLWTLPSGDCNYSQRIARLKTLFTRSLRGRRSLPETVSDSRRKHRESDVWQRRFWEHTIRNEADLERHLDYIHYNPVKHGLVSCPHLWEYSSFHKWVERDGYEVNWGCTCAGRELQVPDFSAIAQRVGE
ncbi:MAG TPA: transposase [Allocoleopsis sp.]